MKCRQCTQLKNEAAKGEERAEERRLRMRVMRVRNVSETSAGKRHVVRARAVRRVRACVYVFAVDRPISTDGGQTDLFRLSIVGPTPQASNRKQARPARRLRTSTNEEDAKFLTPSRPGFLYKLYTAFFLSEYKIFGDLRASVGSIFSSVFLHYGLRRDRFAKSWPKMLHQTAPAHQSPQLAFVVPITIRSTRPLRSQNQPTPLPYPR